MMKHARVIVYYHIMLLMKRYVDVVDVSTCGGKEVFFDRVMLERGSL